MENISVNIEGYTVPRLEKKYAHAIKNVKPNYFAKRDTLYRPPPPPKKINLSPTLEIKSSEFNLRFIRQEKTNFFLSLEKHNQYLRNKHKRGFENK